MSALIIRAMSPSPSSTPRCLVDCEHQQTCGSSGTQIARELRSAPYCGAQRESGLLQSPFCDPTTFASWASFPLSARNGHADCCAMSALRSKAENICSHRAFPVLTTDVFDRPSRFLIPRRECPPVPKSQKIINLALSPAVILGRERIDAGIDADVTNKEIRALDEVSYLINSSPAETTCSSCHGRSPICLTPRIPFFGVDQKLSTALYRRQYIPMFLFAAKSIADRDTNANTTVAPR